MTITVETFDEVCRAIADALDDDHDDEFYGLSERKLFDHLSNKARTKLFAKQLAKAERYKQYLALKEEFERETQ